MRLTGARRAARTLAWVLAWSGMASAGSGCAALRSALASPASPASMDLDLPRLENGTMWSLAAERGHPVVLDVWASWCGPCTQSLPVMDRLAKEYEEKGVRFVGVTVDEDPRAARSFVSEWEVHMPVVWDAGAALTEPALRLGRLPTTLVLDTQGRVAARFEGWSAEDKPALVAAIESVLAPPLPARGSADDRSAAR